MRTVYATPDKVILLGHEGDSFTTKVVFSLDLFNNTEVSDEEQRYYLLIEKNGEQYQQAITLNNITNEIIWFVDSKNTELAGDGRCQLFHVVGTSQESFIFETRVKASISRNFIFKNLTGEISIEDLLPESGTKGMVLTKNSPNELIWAYPYVKCTLAEYNAMTSHDANTVYMIVG